MILGLLGSALLLIKSILSFTQTGPQVKEEILNYYRSYSLIALLRLGFWAILIIAWMAWVGSIPYIALILAENGEAAWLGMLLSGAIGILVITILQFSHQLLHIPSSIMMSSNYKMGRFLWLWNLLTVSRLRWAHVIIAILLALSIYKATKAIYSSENYHELFLFIGIVVSVLLPYIYVQWPWVINKSRKVSKTQDKPNIIMIGCDTLRVDRLGAAGYGHSITPFIDAFTQRGTSFLNCYTPLARTAPSLVTLLTGTWPTTHRIRDNFVSDNESVINVTGLANTLSNEGYQSVAISDWAGSDLGKFSFGFDHLDVPPDQWNLKYFIRQGPKDIRLFLSLFTHNRFGKKFLPEIYYLAGVPLTKHLGASARKWINHFSKSDEPFFMNVFMATSHPPFGSEYPYYTMFTNKDYSGESKFAMSRLVDPFDVIRSMKEPRESFELDQVVNLYDSCVRRFDDEVRGIIHHLEQSGLADKTIVVIYSDHGMELFEHDTWGQGNSAVGEASPKVPFVIVDPRKSGQNADHRVVRTVDILPTLLELCSIEIPEHVDGESLVPYLQDKSIDWDLPAYFETGIWLARPPGQDDDHLRYPELMDLLDVPDRLSGTLTIKDKYKDIVIHARDRMVRKGDWKLVRYPHNNGDVFELFNLKTDPLCINNIASTHQDIVMKMKENLDAWLGVDKIKGYH